MKNFKKVLLVAVFSLLVTVTSVSAATNWLIGEQFDTNGKTIQKTGSRTGNFYNGLELLEKYSTGTMTIQLKGEKKVLLVYTQVGSVKNVNISGTGALNHEIVDNNYSASGTNNVRLTWKQTTSGHTAAFLRY